MPTSTLKLLNPPIVEAVIDIDCDMPLTLDLTSLETGIKESLGTTYPTVRAIHLQGIHVEALDGVEPTIRKSQGLQGYQALVLGEKQIVQFRAQGFSFNKLSPYSSLDEYLPEIERTWGMFVEIAKPIQVKQIRLRYINRLILPMGLANIELNTYFSCGPNLPDDERLGMLGFLHQYSAIELATQNRANVVLAAQPIETGNLPVIFDIGVHVDAMLEPSNWQAISKAIQSLRLLKNSIFEKTLTKTCLDLFQSPL